MGCCPSKNTGVKPSKQAEKPEEPKADDMALSPSVQSSEENKTPPTEPIPTASQVSEEDRRERRQARKERRREARRLAKETPVEGVESEVFADLPRQASFKNTATDQRGLQPQGGPRFPYHLGEPTVKGVETKCFKEGLLYREVVGDKWYYYNDSQEHEMHIKVFFGHSSKVVPLGFTEEQEEEKGKALSNVVFPGETIEFCQGKVEFHKNCIVAKPLSDEYRQKIVKIADKKIKQEKIKPKKGKTVLEQCIEEHLPFVDPEFPPVQSSLSRETDERKLPLMPWQRPTDYLNDKQVKTIRKFDEIHPDNVDEGILGDCWFLSAFAAAAEFPARIKNIFSVPADPEQRKAEEAVGVYRILLNKGGWWQDVVVDNYFPVIGGRPCFSRNLEDPGELWISLLEKAYAKVHGSYAAIRSGDALQALQDLTGFPTSRVDHEFEVAHKDKNAGNALFQKFRRWDKEGYCMCVNTPGTGGMIGSAEREMRYKAVGLAMGHAYTVLEVRQFPDEGFQLMKIRNPWGRAIEWNGKWSDTSPLWQQYPHIAKKCKLEVAQDGCFWMEWEDIKRYFDGAGVCFSRPNWFDYRVKGLFSRTIPSVAIEIRVTRPVDVFFTLSQTDRRGVPEDDPLHQYAAILISVARTEDKGKMTIHSNSSVDATAPTDKFAFAYARDLALKYTIEPRYSPYVIIPRQYGSPEGVDRPFSLGILSHAPVNDDFQVSFVQMDTENRVFQNYPTFTYKGALPTSTEYQLMLPDELPETRVGEAIE